MVSDAARKFADRRTKIAHNYITKSHLQRSMFTGCDQYVTYGFEVFLIEPDFDCDIPRVRTESPLGGYPETDRWGNLLSYSKVWRKPAHELAALYPDLRVEILGKDQFGNVNVDSNVMLELIRYIDKDQTVMFLPARGDLLLDQYDNLIDEINVEIAFRPNGEDDDPTGQFDDVLWIQIARAYMALLGLEATEKSVQAPLAVPSDVQEFAFGPDSVIRSQNPQMIKRVGLELPPGAFQEQQMLDDEQRVGARYPDARSGNVQSSVITGQGVQALMGGFDTQIKTAQEVLRDALRNVMRKCFKMDEAIWPNLAKTIRGEHAGAPFEITYTPAKDIKGDYTIDVTYGFMAGLQPNQALVFGLQLRGDKLISRDFLQRQMPFDVSITELQAQIDVEETRDALKQAVFGVGQALPEMVAQGQDPTTTINQMAALIAALQKGVSIEDAAIAAFQPPPPPPPDPNAPPGGAGAVGPDGSTPGIAPNGQVSGVAPGQAGEGPGGRPGLQALLAGLTSSGAPSLQDNITQRVPIQP